MSDEVSIVVERGCSLVESKWSMRGAAIIDSWSATAKRAGKVTHVEKSYYVDTTVLAVHREMLKRARLALQNAMIAHAAQYDQSGTYPIKIEVSRSIHLEFGFYVDYGVNYFASVHDHGRLIALTSGKTAEEAESKMRQRLKELHEQQLAERDVWLKFLTCEVTYE
jgi:hypothetical protein